MGGLGLVGMVVYLLFFFCFWFCCFCDSMHSDTLGFLFSFLMHCFPRLLFFYCLFCLGVVGCLMYDTYRETRVD